MSLRKHCYIFPVLLLLITSASAQSLLPEQRTERALEATRKLGPVAVHGFLAEMPKGSDLHMHMTGSVYAETFLKDAVVDNLCVNLTTFVLTRSIGLTKELPVHPVCPEGQVPAANAFKDRRLYDTLIDAFSMRNFVPVAGFSGHDQFFSVFDRFNALDRVHKGEWLDEIATRAAAQNEQYLEIMHTPAQVVPNALRLAADIPWPDAPVTTGDFNQDTTGTTTAQLVRLHEQVLDKGFREAIDSARKEYADALTARNRIEHCGQPDAVPACLVQIRFLYQILRGGEPMFVYAQTLAAFELASTDPDVVGINFVQPEDCSYCMADYTRQMKMLDYLHSLYPKVHISLHAGELAPGLVPPEGLRFHIRQAIELGHAERIGHGVDVGYEDHSAQLLKEMAAKHVMVEVNLTSNDVILGVSGKQHPLGLYRKAHVPVSLSTDDEGVSRIDLTHEYVRALEEYGLTYPELKQMVRTGMEHVFFPGASLWATPDEFTVVAKPCAGLVLGADRPTADCRVYLEANPKAAQQWELERRFKVFEAKF